MLVKEGLSLQFLTLVFQTWLSEKNIGHISSALRKAQLEARLTVLLMILDCQEFRLLVVICCGKSVSILAQDFLPASQQSAQHFDEHFSKVGLEVLVKYRRAQESAEKRRALKTELEELLENEANSEEVIDRCQQHMETAQLSDVDVTVLVSVWASSA